VHLPVFVAILVLGAGIRRVYQGAHIDDREDDAEDSEGIRGVQDTTQKVTAAFPPPPSSQAGPQQEQAPPTPAAPQEQAAQPLMQEALAQQFQQTGKKPTISQVSKDYNLTLRAANTLLKEMDVQGLFTKRQAEEAPTLGEIK
jgi:hypothetical protein